MNSLPGSIKIATSWLVRSSAIQKIIWPLASNTVDAGLEKKRLSGMPAPTTVDEFGIVHQRRNDAWINPWNPAIASCIRSNHDISWIPTVSKSLSLIYYITNYSTKDDISPEQMLAKAALLKQSIEKAKMTEHPTAAETRLREKGMDQFALCCFNTLANLREISGVQVIILSFNIRILTPLVVGSSVSTSGG